MVRPSEGMLDLFALLCDSFEDLDIRTLKASNLFAEFCEGMTAESADDLLLKLKVLLWVASVRLEAFATLLGPKFLNVVHEYWECHPKDVQHCLDMANDLDIGPNYNPSIN